MIRSKTQTPSPSVNVKLMWGLKVIDPNKFEATISGKHPGDCFYQYKWLQSSDSQWSVTVSSSPADSTMTKGGLSVTESTPK